MRPKMSFWVLLDQKLQKTIVIFGISTLLFPEMQKIVQNTEKIKFGYFGSAFRAILTIINFETKNA